MSTWMLQIGTRTGSGYPIQLFELSPGGNAIPGPTAWIPVDGVLADPVDLDGEPITLEQARGLMLQTAAESAAFSATGAYLWALLARDEVGTALSRALAPADRGPRPRLLLEVHDPDLRALPWELIRGDGPLPIFGRYDCARVAGFDPNAARPRCSPQLRVLIVIGAGARENPTLFVQEEVDGIAAGLARAWGLVDLEILDRPDITALEHAYEDLDPHILHFIGHSVADGGGLQVGVKDAQDAWTLDPAALTALLEPPPRLAVINACRSGTASGQAGVWKVGDVLTELGIAATISMTGDIRGDAAAACAAALYSGIAKECSVNECVREARKAIRATVGSFERPEPWLPSLLLSVPPDRVLPRRSVVEAPVLEAITNGYRGIRCFVDRTPQRRVLWKDLADLGDATEASGGVQVVRGISRVGRSALLRWCIGCAALRGANTAYIDLRGPPKIDWLQALGRIALELSRSPVYGPRNRSALEGFAAALDALPGPSPNRSSDPWERRLVRPYPSASGGLSPDGISDLFDHFWDALGVLVADGPEPLILGVDHLDGVEEAYVSHYLGPLLIGPPARGETPVRLMLALTDHEWQVANLTGPFVRSERIEMLPAAEFEALASEYVAARGCSSQAVRQAIQGLAAAGKDWNADTFGLLDNIIDYVSGTDG